MPHYSLDIYTGLVPNNVSYSSEDLGYIINLYNINLMRFRKEQPFTMNVRLCLGLVSYSMVSYFNGTYFQGRDSGVYTEIFKKELEEI